jgi:hypothetical protein
LTLAAASTAKTKHNQTNQATPSEYSAREEETGQASTAAPMTPTKF